MRNITRTENEVTKKLKEFSKIFIEMKYDLIWLSQNNFLVRIKSLDLRIIRFFEEINTNFNYLDVFDYKLKKRRPHSISDFCNLKSNSLLNIINDIETYGLKRESIFTKLLKVKGKHTFNFGIYKYEREI